MSRAIISLGAALLVLSSTSDVTAQPVADNSKSVKFGVIVTTPTGQGMLAAFSVVGPSEKIKALEARVIALKCPKPLVRVGGAEASIFAPLAESCDSQEAVALVNELQSGSDPELHNLDVQFFNLPQQSK